MVDYVDWLKTAATKVENLPKNTRFVLRDLFEGTKWNTLQNRERRELGRKFRYCVDSNRILNVIVIDSPKGVATTYKKT